MKIMLMPDYIEGRPSFYAFYTYWCLDDLLSRPYIVLEDYDIDNKLLITGSALFLFLRDDAELPLGSVHLLEITGFCIHEHHEDFVPIITYKDHGKLIDSSQQDNPLINFPLYNPAGLKRDS